MDFGAALRRNETDGQGQGKIEVLPPVKVYSLEAVKPSFGPIIADVEKMISDAREIEIRDDGSLKFAVALGGAAKKIAKLLEVKADEVTAEASDYVKSVKGFVKMFTERLVSNPKKSNPECIEAILKKKIGDYQNIVELERRKREEAARKAKEELQRKLDAEAEEANRKAREEAARKAEEEARKNAASEAEIAAAKKAAEEEAAKHNIEAPTIPDPVFQKTDTVTRTETGAAAFSRKPWKFEVENLAEVPEEYTKRVINDQAIKDAIKQGVREIKGIRIYQENQINFRS